MKEIELTQEQKERIRQIQLEMVKQLAALCDRHKIKYCLGYGSLLGAVRNQGFIPWDDDVDILMLRRDYEKFRRICTKELDSRYFLQDYKSDPAYLWGYAKLRNVKTVYVRSGQEHIPCQGGVFIDIFPLDDIPDFVVFQMIQDFVCFVLRKILWARVGRYQGKNAFFRMIYRCMALVPKGAVYRIRNVMIRARPPGKKVKESQRVRCLLFTAPGKHWGKKRNPLNTRYGFLRSWIEDRSKFTFEKNQFWSTKEYDGCLRYLYGDYLTLPPVEKRVGHAPVSQLNLDAEHEDTV